MEPLAISLVIPVYNEEESITPLLEEAFSTFNEQDFPQFECVVVDDASKDKTLEVLLKLCQRFPRLRVVKHVKNSGQSAAVVTGVYAAKHPWIATVDGDGQNPPAEILKLIKAKPDDTSRGCLLIGHRTKRNDSFVKRLSSRVANKVRRAILKDDCPDTGCGLKLFTRNTFIRLPLFKNCHRFMPALFNRAGVKAISVPIAHRDRERGQSKYGVMNRLWVGIIDMFGVAWLARRPLSHDSEEKTP